MLAVLLIAVVDALCSYAEKYLTTSVGQWVMHDLRRTLYSHIQRLSLAYHDQKQTGDLISRVTGDIDAIQSFIASGLLGALVDCLTLLGMVGVMFYLNWRFTLVALSVAPRSFCHRLFVHAPHQEGHARGEEKRGRDGVHRPGSALLHSRGAGRSGGRIMSSAGLEEQSLESVEAALHARGLKARLAAPRADYRGRGYLPGALVWRPDGAGETLSVGSLIIFIFYLEKMYKPMQDLSKMTDTYSKAAAGYERIRGGAGNGQSD